MYNEVKTSCRVLLFFLESLNDIQHVALLDNFHRMADDSKTHIIESHCVQTPVLAATVLTGSTTDNEIVVSDLPHHHGPEEHIICHVGEWGSKELDLLNKDLEGNVILQDHVAGTT